MPSLGDVLRSFSDPLGPLLRERLERVLPRGSSLTELVLASGEARLFGLVVPLGTFRVVVPQARFQLSLLSLGAKATLRDTEGTLVDTSGTEVAQIRFEASLRRDAWAAGSLVVTAGDLTARARLEVVDGRVSLREVRVVGAAGTALEGSLEVTGEVLAAALEGKLHGGDLPVGALLDPSVLPLEIRDLSVQTKLLAEGTTGTPRVALTVGLHDLPLRAPGRKRFLPHLRIGDGGLVLRSSGTRHSLEGRVTFAGGGAVSLAGTSHGERHELHAELQRMGPTAIRHILELAGVCVPAWERGELSGTVALSADGSGAPQIAAALEAPHVTLGVRDARFPFEGARATVSGALTRPAVDVTAMLDDGALTLSIGPETPLVVTLTNARARSLARLSMADPSMVPLVVDGDPPRPGAFVLPAAWQVDVRAEPRSGALEASVSLGHGETRVRVALSTRDGAHVASSLRGALTAEDTSTLFDLPTRAKGVSYAGAPVRFDLALSGSAEAPSILGAVTTEGLVIGYEGRTLTVGEARGRVHVAPRFVAFHDVRAAIGSGFMLGAGVLLPSPRGPALRASFVSDNIRIGRAELFPEGPPIDGRAFAHAGVRHGGDGTVAEVRLRLEGPTYTFLPKATARLERLGLPSVPIAGDRPLEAHAKLEGDVLRVRDLRASVAGLSAHGSGEASEGGKVLAADVRVTATAAWLSRSALLRVPGAVLGTVELPVRVRGSLARPETESDLARALWTSLTRGGRRRESPHLALPPASLSFPAVPFEDGTPDAHDVYALALGTLPLADLERIAERFVSGEPSADGAGGAAGTDLRV